MEILSLLLLAEGLLVDGDGLDDSDGNSLPHVTDGETSKRGEVGEALDAKGLGGLEVDDASISGLDELGVGLEDLSGTAVHLLLDELELARNVGGVAIEDGRVSVSDLSRVVHDNDLGLEASGTGGGALLGVGADVSAAEVLDGNVLDVESDVVSGDGLGERLVVHLDGLDLSGEADGGDHGDDTGLDDSGLDTADGNSSDSSNLVDILEGKAEGLVGGPLGGVDVVKGLKEVGSLVPGHVGGLVDHVVSLPSGDGDEGDLHGLVPDLLEVGRDLSLDLLVTLLVVLDGLVVHLVAADNHLLDTEGEGKKGVLAGLSVLGDTGLESSLGGVNAENGNIGLTGSGDHVLDEITVSGGVNDGEGELGGLELPEGDVDGDSTLALGLEVVKDPGILEGSLSELGGLLLVLLNGTLVDTSALVDPVSVCACVCVCVLWVGVCVYVLCECEYCAATINKSNVPSTSNGHMMLCNMTLMGIYLHCVRSI